MSSEIDDPEFVKVLQEEFFAESSETLNECENLLMKLEKNLSAQEEMVDYKRALHTMKGSAMAVGLKKTGEIFHYLETQIVLAPTLDVIEKQLRAIDVFREFFEQAIPGEGQVAERILDKIKR